MGRSNNSDSISFRDTDLDRRRFMQFASVVAGVGPMTAMAGCVGGNGDDDDDDPGAVDIGDDDDDGDDEPDSDPRYGGTLHVGSQEPFTGADPDLVTLSPDFAALRNIVEPLYVTDYDGAVIPWLAEDLELEDDGFTWVIPLEEDAHFHPPVDHTLTAEDVVRSYDRVSNPDLGSPRIDQFDVDGMSWHARDEKTFVLEFEDSIFAGFQGSMAARGGEILPAELIDEILDDPVDEIGEPIGTGPYMFDEWVEREGYTLTRFDNYWQDFEGDQLPYFDRIRVRPVTEASIRLTELQNKDMHIDHEPSMDFIEEYDEAEGVNVTISDTPMGRSQLATNCSDYTMENRAGAPNPPTLQSEVRFAMQEAMDRNDYIDLVYRGFGSPNQQYYPPAFPWVNDAAPWGADQDLQAAEELLDDVGYDGGEITIINRSANEREMTMGEILSDHLGAAGIGVDRQILEVGVWTDHLTRAEYDIRPGAGAVEGDPIIFDTGRYMERESPQHYFGGPDNRSEEVGELFDEAANEAVHEDRVELYQEGFEIIAEDSSYIMTCHNPQLGATIDEVQNYREHPSLFNTNWRECWFTDPDEFAE